MQQEEDEPLHAVCARELEAAWVRKQEAFAASVEAPSSAPKRIAYRRSLSALRDTLAVLGGIVRNRGSAERELLSNHVAAHEPEFIHFRTAAHRYWLTAERANLGEVPPQEAEIAFQNLARANAAIELALAKRRAAFEATHLHQVSPELREAEGEILVDWERAGAACRAHFGSACGP